MNPVWLDPSFLELLRRHPELEAMHRYLPATPTATIFDGQQQINALQSSYVARGYGAVLYALIRVLKPLRAVEIGLFQGFSLLSAAAALRDNGAGHIAGYDLFDAYPYRHADWEQLTRQTRASGLDHWVTIQPGDAGDVHQQWEGVDYLHVDISNNGDTYRQVFDRWSPKVRQVILLEGGSVERDNVDWMRRYGKPPMAAAVIDLERSYAGWSFTVLQPFPSMTIACNQAAIAAIGER
jgi:predicted O-methyltransferase YrrM